MKKVFFLAAACCSLLLAGCFDTEEVIEVKEDGTASYRSTMDMSGMFDMLEMFASLDTSANGIMSKLGGKQFDTSFLLDSRLDTATDMSEEQKHLMRGTRMAMNMNSDARTFRIAVDYGSRPMSDLAKLLTMTSSGEALSAFGREGMPALPQAEAGPKPSDAFRFDIAPGRLRRTIDPAVMREMIKGGGMDGMEQMSGMMESMTFTTLIRLPRPATRAEGEKVSLSADRRVVTIKSTMADLLEKPASLHYNIEY